MAVHRTGVVMRFIAGIFGRYRFKAKGVIRAASVFLLFIVFFSLATPVHAEKLYLEELGGLGFFVGGTDYRGLENTISGSEDLSTKVDIDPGTTQKMYFDPMTTSNVAGTPDGTPVGYGWASVYPYGGTIPAGDWTFSLKLEDTGTGSAGYIGIYVFKNCAGTDTLLFGTWNDTDILGLLVANTPATMFFHTVNPGAISLDGCYLKVEYWLNLTTADTAGGGDNLEVYTSSVGSYIEFPDITVGQSTESRGNQSYSWHQVLTGNISRLTGSADREYYDYGYKPIQIYARVEDYWAQDCGWWYISDSKTVDITIMDGKDDTVGSWTSEPTSKGQKLVEHSWANSHDPGRWTVTVQDNTAATNIATFYLYVRGQLNVSNITNSSNPTSGSQVTIYANITDHAGTKVNGSALDNAGTSVEPNVTAYVTGAGDDLIVELLDDGNAPDAAIDGEWTGQFTPQRPGDHKIIVKASDGHQYWIDGRGSQWLYVTGQFPYASLGLSFFEFFKPLGIGWVRMGSLLLLGIVVSSLFIQRRWGEGL